MNNIEYVESNMVLNSYSSSEGFKGFCETKVGWKDQNYIRSLLKILTHLVGNLHVVSSLNIYIDLDESVKKYSLNKEEIACQNLLLKSGIITNITEGASREFFHISKDVDENLALNIIRYVASIDGAFGHLFFVDMNSGVIIYPHDDCGLGFIFRGDKASQDQKLSFLKTEAEKYKDIMSFVLDRNWGKRPVQTSN